MGSIVKNQTNHVCFKAGLRRQYFSFYYCGCITVRRELDSVYQSLIHLLWIEGACRLTATVFCNGIIRKSDPSNGEFILLVRAFVFRTRNHFRVVQLFVSLLRYDRMCPIVGRHDNFTA